MNYDRVNCLRSRVTRQHGAKALKRQKQWVELYQRGEGTSNFICGMIFSRGLSDEEAEKFQCHERTERPPDVDHFIARLENAPGRMLHEQKPGTMWFQRKFRYLKN